MQQTCWLAWKQLYIVWWAEIKDDIGGKVLRTGHLILLAYPIWQSVFDQAINLFKEKYKVPNETGDE